jgi:Co/Zn/Cd efflux system component
MSAHCKHHDHTPSTQERHSDCYKRILWIALFVNLAMFGVEIFAGALSGSVSLLADAIDFLSDAFNYGLSLAVLGMAVAWRSRAALFKGICMLGFGLAVLAKTAWAVQYGAPPQAATMGMVGLLALAANASVAAMLYAYREGDANMRSVWLCTRNDAIGNVAVLLAALGVFGTGSAWPDLLVAAIMASLALVGGWSVLKQALRELRGDTGKSI